MAMASNLLAMDSDPKPGFEPSKKILSDVRGLEIHKLAERHWTAII